MLSKFNFLSRRQRQSVIRDSNLQNTVTKYGFGKHIGTVSNFSDRAMFLKV